MSIAKLTEAAPQADNKDLAAGIRVLETEARALDEFSRFLNDTFAQAVELIAAAEGRIIIAGMGKSGHVGKKIAATFASTGTPSFFVHPAEASHGDMGMIVRGDIVLAISNSGEAKEMNDLIEYTRRFAIPLIGVTSRPQSTLASRADIALLLPPCPEACPNGLAPTTSTTLTMALGDALAVALLERRGFTESDFKIFHPGGKLGQQLMQVSEIMHKDAALPVADENISMAEAVEIITQKGFGCVGLTDAQGRLSGVITDGDIRRHYGQDLSGKRAKDVMSKNPVTTRPEALVAETMAIMNGLAPESPRKVTCLIVADKDNKPVGLLHIHDCLRAGFA